MRFTQVAVIEFARNVLGVKDADSTEFNPGTPNPAVVFMPEISTKHMGGTMRLGGRRTVLQVRRVIGIDRNLPQIVKYMSKQFAAACRASRCHLVHEWLQPMRCKYGLAAAGQCCRLLLLYH
jgi:hypothetical protein